MALLFARGSLPAIVENALRMSSRLTTASFSTGDFGSGAGKGGGSGGSIRDAGGSFGKMEAAREEEYFRRLQKSQLKGLRDQLDDEVEFHERHMKHHQDAIERHKKRMADLKREEELFDKK